MANEYVVIEQDQMGNPTLVQHRITNRIYRPGQDGRLIEVNPASLQQQQQPVYQQPQQQPQQQPMYQQPQYQQQQTSIQGIGSIYTGNQQQSVHTTTNKPRGYNGRKPVQQEIPVVQNVGSEPKIHVKPTILHSTDFNPAPGSELIPMTNTDTHRVEFIATEGSGVYKLIVVKGE